MFATLHREWTIQRVLARQLGWPESLVYRAQRLRARRYPGRLYRLLSRHAWYPLWFRPRTTDLWVFHQINSWREYRCLDDLDPASVGLVIDCGAYVGYSAAYFLTRFPACRVVAVEPDPDNRELAARNLAPYGSRAELMPAGVWSAPIALAFDTAPFGDGREWARHLRRADPGVDGLPGVTIGSLLDRSGFDRISILKMDIEGAEAEVFAGDCAWLDRTDTLVIELHGPACEAAFHRAIAGRGFTLSRCDELTVCRR